MVSIPDGLGINKTSNLSYLIKFEIYTNYKDKRHICNVLFTFFLFRYRYHIDATILYNRRGYGSCYLNSASDHHHQLA